MITNTAYFFSSSFLSEERESDGNGGKRVERPNYDGETRRTRKPEGGETECFSHVISREEILWDKQARK